MNSGTTSVWALGTLMLGLTFGVGCGASASKSADQDATHASARPERISTGDAGKLAPHRKGAVAYTYLAGGCFWGVEHYLEKLSGVHEVVSGYMGGHVANPTYKQVIGKKTGHLETVKVAYDPKQVSFETIAKLFFEIHDPTQKDGQGPDIGPQYLSAVFYANAEQKRVVEGLMGQLSSTGMDVATILRPIDGPFWPAEAFHQDYYARTGKYPYCHKRVKRFAD